MDSSDLAGSLDPGKRVKVARLVNHYELNIAGAELERLWTAEGEDQLSLRDLADYFNRKLLAHAMTIAGMQPLDGQVENLY
jgi:hypothetical protein